MDKAVIPKKPFAFFFFPQSSLYTTYSLKPCRNFVSGTYFPILSVFKEATKGISSIRSDSVEHTCMFLYKQIIPLLFVLQSI